MKTKLFLGLQILTGLLLVVFGLNGFLQFLPAPVNNEAMNQFTNAVYQTGYIFPIMATINILAGVSFIFNKYTAFMSVIVMPFMLNALLAHIFLDIKGIEPSFFIVFATIIVMIKNKDAYFLLFKK